MCKIPCERQKDGTAAVPSLAIRHLYENNRGESVTDGCQRHFAGSSAVNFIQLPYSLSAKILPPCSSHTAFAMARPRP